MLCLFVDETGDGKEQAVCCLAVKHNHYSLVKRRFLEILKTNGWDPSVEFKGAYIFSSTKGVSSVTVETRITIANQVVALATADKNARMKFFYTQGESENRKDFYLKRLAILVERVLSQDRSSRKSGKDLVALCIDERSDISVSEVRMTISNLLAKRDRVLFEDVVSVRSNSDAVGIALADIVGYLTWLSRKVLKDENILLELSNGIVDKNNPKVAKLIQSLIVLSKIKSFAVIDT